jgi:hypothetical protein
MNFFNWSANCRDDVLAPPLATPPPPPPPPPPPLGGSPARAELLPAARILFFAWGLLAKTMKKSAKFCQSKNDNGKINL